MQYQTKLEMKRLHRIMPNNGFLYFYPLLDDYNSQKSIESVRAHRLWTWQDSSKIVAFVDMHLMRSRKYGLDIGPLINSGLTKDELKAEEDRLTEFFVNEMRKKPVAA